MGQNDTGGESLTDSDLCWQELSSLVSQHVPFLKTELKKMKWCVLANKISRICRMLGMPMTHVWGLINRRPRFDSWVGKIPRRRHSNPI